MLLKIWYEGQSYDLDLGEDDVQDCPISLLKAMVYSVIDVEPDLFQLCLQDTRPTDALDEEELVSDHPIHHGTNIYVHLKALHEEEEKIPQDILEMMIPWKETCTRVLFQQETLLQPHYTTNGLVSCIGCSQMCQQTTPRQQPASSPKPTVCQCTPCLFRERIDSFCETLSTSFQRQLKPIISAQYDKQLEPLVQENLKQMQSRLLSTFNSISGFEDPQSIRRALQLIPVNIQTAEESKHSQLKLLLEWFKKEFFVWVNSPVCSGCGSKETKGIGMAQPLEEELKFGCGRVEMYQCTQCLGKERFPRYNHPGKLLETRRGRCGEWAQAFVLCCRALGYCCRYVVDWTDHVWAELFVGGQWLHADPCENVLDAPLMYEKGWGKKLGYVIAFSREEVRDVSKRYTEDWEGMLGRRGLCSEKWLESAIGMLNRKIQSRQSKQVRERVEQRWIKEQTELGKKEEKSTLHQAEQQGRETGSEEWKRSRGELGE